MTHTHTQEQTAHNGIDYVPIFVCPKNFVCLLHLLKEELSGGVLDLRCKGCWFKLHWRHHVVSLNKTLFVFLFYGLYGISPQRQKCAKFETCAILRRFLILYTSCDCNKKLRTTTSILKRSNDLIFFTTDLQTVNYYIIIHCLS